jgi:hypothetical protein
MTIPAELLRSLSENLLLPKKGLRRSCTAHGGYPASAARSKGRHRI